MSDPSQDPSTVAAAVDAADGLPLAQRIVVLESAAEDLESALRHAEQ